MIRYLDRDVSWISFNYRVLDEIDKNIPMAEKFLFAGICSSNLEEFMMVRYPARIDMPYEIDDITDIVERLQSDIETHYEKINIKFDEINELERVIIRIKDIRNTGTMKYLESFFKKNIFPVLQPMTINNKRINPKSKSINIFVETEDKNGTLYHNEVNIPDVLGRFIELPDSKSFILIEDLVTYYLDFVFKGMKIKRCCVYTVLRSSEVFINDDSLDTFEVIEKSLKARESSWITCLELDDDSDQQYIRLLKGYLNVSENTIVLSNDIIKLSDLKSIDGKVFSEDNRMRKYTPTNPFNKNVSMFDIIREKDRLVFHPFESFNDSFVRFIKEAATDENTLSMKITLYRVADKSKIIDALLLAAENGKAVTVLVELKARFDEKHNLQISKILKEAGVNIIYGHENLKTHCKICLITRREGKNGKIKIYSHIGTGNYNEQNAKVYTDYSYFTADQATGKDLTSFFNLLTSTQYEFESKEIVYAPHGMRKNITNHIEKEIEQAGKGKPARIIFKCNSLTDDKIADKLYEASKAGVKVILIIRSACIIRPGIKGLSENIRVYSVVGRFLEHSRIYIFGKGDRETIYIGSSDIMHRNLNIRNELLINIRNKGIKERVKSHIKAYLRDNINRRVILDDYQYKDAKRKKSDKKIDCHKTFIEEAQKRDI